VVEEGLLGELERRVARLRAIFDLSQLQGQGDSPATIRRYYERSRPGYRFVHSRHGAMHMALNPGPAFDPAGYAGQALLVHERLAPDARDVLELACGNGFNLELLARRNPGRRFTGIDLVTAQVRRARRTLAELPNADARVGDFQALSFADASQDCVFAVESLCHATDLPRTLEEIARVLRPGGMLIAIDGWRTDAFDELPGVVREATVAIERAMAVSDGQKLGTWIARAQACGLQVSEDLDLTPLIGPNLARLEALAQRFVARPRVARAARLVAPRSLLLNAVAAYLMPLAVAAGAHTYRLVAFELAR
jgi:SAM-dependent methyltransferase